MPTTFVILPVHNRRAITLRCLANLQQTGVFGWAQIVVVDDGSTDGTGDAVRAQFPAVRILPGDGNLWWGGAIRLGMDDAMRSGADFLVWLNDDCLPAPGTLRRLVDHVARTGGVASGWAGTPSGGSYGALRATWRGLQPAAIPGADGVQPCEAAGGNCVAFARAVVDAIGLPDAARLPHALLDADYTLTATRAGFPLDLLGSARCQNDDNLHPATASWLLAEQSPMEQWKLFLRPHSTHGYHASLCLHWKHWGIWGLWLYARGYLKLALVCAIRAVVPLRWLHALYATRSSAWQRQEFHRRAAHKVLASSAPDRHTDASTSMPLFSGSPRPSLLLISATYTTEENRKKLLALSRHFEVTCATCDQYVQYGLLNRVEPGASSAYRLIGLPFVGKPASTTRYLLRGLGRVFRDHPADVVLVEAEPWAWIRWQAWWWKVRYCPRALFGEYSAENLERSGLKGRVLDVFYRAAVRTADFVAICNHAGGEIYRRRGLPPERLLVSPQLGVDATLFCPVDDAERARLRRESDLPTDGFLVGFCGRLVESKGILDLIEAVRRVRRQRPDRNVHLGVLGSGPLRETLAALPDAADFLHLLPPRMHDGVAPYMQGLDLFVLPSKPDTTGPDVWEEQFGYVLIQAMACAVPTVGSDSGAIPEVINLPSMIVPAGNVDALTDKLLALLDDPRARAEAAQQQRDQTVALYENEELGDLWAGFIRRQLSDQREPAVSQAVA